MQSSSMHTQRLLCIHNNIGVRHTGQKRMQQQKPIDVNDLQSALFCSIDDVHHPIRRKACGVLHAVAVWFLSCCNGKAAVKVAHAF